MTTATDAVFALAPPARTSYFSRTSRRVAAVATALLLVQLGGQAAAGAAANTYSPLQPQVEHSVGGTDWTAPKTTPEANPAAEHALKTAKQPSWPAAGTATVDLSAAKAARTAGVHPTRAANLPIVLDKAGVGTKAQAPTPTSVGVQLLDHAKTNAVGLPLVMRLTQTANATTDGAVNVAVDYSSFKDAYGADWSSRLRLASVPACALTGKTDDTCRITPIPTHNDLASHTLSADVVLPSTTTGITSAQTADAAVTLAVTAGPSGSAGDFAASAPSASSTWSAGGSSGDFTWSYPLRMPPAMGGPEPSVAFAYSAQSVDGHTAASNNQPSWLGEGFNFSPGSISRGYKSCSDDMGGNATNTTKTDDLCWGTYNATLTMSGHGGELIRDDATGKYRLRNDDGTRVELLTGASNGDNNGEYWRVTTDDGTQYFFGLNRLPGWTSGKSETGSTWTVPVFGNNPGVSPQPDEPCYNATFANAYCDQAWQWNLDYVVDMHGNTMSLWYGKESNNYARNKTDSKVSPYVRGGYLDRIDYGTDKRTLVNGIATDTEYTGTKPAYTVDFTVKNRCLPNTTCDTAHPENWPDVPWDQNCTSSTSCPGQYAPTYFTQYRLDSVKTQVWGGSAYRDIESWTLNHLYPDPGDGTRAGLWLDRISHKGLVAASTTVEGPNITLPDVTFTGTQKQNRVDTDNDNLLKMNWWRIAYITTETGGKIGVTYKQPDCGPGNLPSAADNRTRCFPIYWTRPGYTSPTIDWFFKYVVDTVTETDMTTTKIGGGNPRVITQYTYGTPTSALWHYDDDDGLVPANRKTWGQWRGYSQVDTVQGDPGEQTMTRSRYFRGMNGDKAASGTRTVTVDGIADDDMYAGMPREEIVYNGVGGAEVSGTLHTPWKSPTPTAKRLINGTTVEAHYTGEASTVTRTALDGNRGYRTQTQTNTFDNTYGYVTQSSNSGDDAVTGDEQCATTSRLNNTTAWIIGVPSKVEQYALPCGTSPTTEDDIISIDRTYYDGQAWGVAPAKGDVTQADRAKSWSSTAIGWVTQTKTAYDAVTGRVTDSWDVRNVKTTTAYTPASGGPVTKIVTTGPFGAATTDYEPAWGLPVDVIDVNGRRTDATYDALGRLKGVWRANRSKAAGATANVTYAYTISNSVPSSVTTNKINATGGYTASYELFDSLVRPRQQQAPAKAGGGRIISDTYYDSAGRVSVTNATYYNSAAAGTTIYNPNFNELPAQTVKTYDGAGRVVRETLMSAGLEKWHSTIAYGGDRIDATPPQGGTATSTSNDYLGNKTKVVQYLAPTPTGPGDTTTYEYDRRGFLKKITDPVGNKWTYTRDLLGRIKTSTDPDKGTVVNDYNDYGDLKTTTDDRHKTVAYSYDFVGRRTGTYDTSTTGTKLAEWTYDTALLSSDGVTPAKGYLASATRYIDGYAYTFTTRGYTDLYGPTGTNIVIPSVPGEEGLAGTYIYQNTYNADGTTNTFRYPPAGGLTAEIVTTEYDTTTGLEATLKTNYAGATYYVTGTQYTSYGEPSVITMATALSGAKVAQTGLYYDEATRLPNEVVSSRETAPSVISDTHYYYDPAGNVIKIADTAAGSAETQCFEPDYLQRLTAAWTPTSGDCATPKATDQLAGPAPYWQSWKYDPAGNRTEQTEHKSAGDQTTVYHYPPAGTARPHALGSTTGATTGTYDYDEAGNTWHRPGSTGTQTLTWDIEGHLKAVSDTSGKNNSYKYTPEGDRLVSHDPTGATLYLPGMEVRLTTATGAVTATRYYTHATKVVAMRTTSGITWLSSDPHGTAEVAINATTQAVTQRRFKPFGEVRSGTGWVNPHGFVNGIDDPTGLTHLGAREYDKTTGRFISVDPILDINNTQQFNAYVYANNSPYTFTDPGGTDFWGWVSDKASSVNDFMNRNAEQIGQAAAGVAMAAAGAALMGAGMGGEALGVALDCTGVGAIVGVPINVISAGAIAAGATMVVGGAVVTGAAVSKMDFEGSGSSTGSSSGGGNPEPPLRPQKEGSWDEADKLRQEADDLHKEWMGDYDQGTVSVANVYDRATGQTQKVVTINGSGELPEQMVSDLQARGYHVVKGNAGEHAETNLIQYVKAANRDNAMKGGSAERYQIVEGGTNRNICDGICAPELESNGLEWDGPGRFRPSNTLTVTRSRTYRSPRNHPLDDI